MNRRQVPSELKEDAQTSHSPWSCEPYRRNGKKNLLCVAGAFYIGMNRTKWI